MRHKSDCNGDTEAVDAGARCEIGVVLWRTWRCERHGIIMPLLVGRYGESGTSTTLPTPWLARLRPDGPSCAQCTLPGALVLQVESGTGPTSPIPCAPLHGCFTHSQFHTDTLFEPGVSGLPVAGWLPAPAAAALRGCCKLAPNEPKLTCHCTVTNIHAITADKVLFLQEGQKQTLDTYAGPWPASDRNTVEQSDKVR
jgi:hypothetical protein